TTAFSCKFINTNLTEVNKILYQRINFEFYSIFMYFCRMKKLDINLDHIDYQILRIMQNNARTNNADIARELGMAPSAILERVKKLEQKEVILQYNAKINPAALDQNLLSFIFIKTSDIIGEQRIAYLLADIPEVQEVHDIAGDDGYLIKVRTSDAAGL